MERDEEITWGVDTLRSPRNPSISPHLRILVEVRRSAIPGDPLISPHLRIPKEMRRGASLRDPLISPHLQIPS